MNKYSDLDERVLSNILREAGNADVIYRQRARYKVVDVPSDKFDEILQRRGVVTYVDRNTRGKYYSVSDIREALRKLLLERGIRPKLDPELLKP